MYTFENKQYYDFHSVWLMRYFTKYENEIKYLYYIICCYIQYKFKLCCAITPIKGLRSKDDKGFMLSPAELFQELIWTLQTFCRKNILDGSVIYKNRFRLIHFKSSCITDPEVFQGRKMSKTLQRCIG